MRKLTIGITYGRKYENYFKWISDRSPVEIIRLSYEFNNLSSVPQCDGIVMTGGEDVHPRFYNKPDYLEKYSLTDIDEKRDEFELELLNQARAVPVLGICRGLQIANVFHGGTLLPDIVSFNKPDHTKFKEGNDRYHALSVEPGSYLASITQSNGEINSAHHQSVDKAGDGLIINAYSNDGIVEGLERNIRDAHPYLLLVQWHPERMNDLQSPFSKNIRDSFFTAMDNR